MGRFHQGNAQLRICVDSTEGGRLTGRVFSQMLTAPMPFSDASQLLLKIEQLLDVQNYPQAFQRTRVFSQKKEEFLPAADSPEVGIPAEEVAAATGAFATVAVNITSRRSSTWQGKIDWGDGEGAQPFSSALAFMLLLDERFLGR